MDGAALPLCTTAVLSVESVPHTLFYRQSATQEPLDLQTR